MKVMLIEDNDSKRCAIVSYMKSKGILAEDIICAKTMTDFAAQLHFDIGLFIIDFKLPSIDSGAALQNGKAILEAIVKAGKHDALLLAISAYPNDFPQLRAEYEAHGCILADYSKTAAWKSTLDHLLIQLKKNIKLDFVVLCALQEERNPYVVLASGNRVIRGGLDCYDISVGKKRGTIVLMPQSGLVNAAITASLCIERFKPSIVGMSGICGGFRDRAQLGQLVVSSMVYEYQSGKWAADGFRHEPYQVSTDSMALTELRALTNSDGLISELEAGYRGSRPRIQQKPETGIFTSGSAVIADRGYLSQIETIHRKVNALDMEIFAIQRAAALSMQRPVCICAKTVVDLCDETKDDELHGYGSYISAKFILKAIENFVLPRPSS